MECYRLDVEAILPRVVEGFLNRKFSPRHRPLLVPSPGDTEFLVLCSDAAGKEMAHFLASQNVTVYATSTEVPKDFPLGRKVQEVSDFVNRNTTSRGRLPMSRR